MKLLKWEVMMIDVRRPHGWPYMELSICNVVADDSYDGELDYTMDMKQ